MAEAAWLRLMAAVSADKLGKADMSVPAEPAVVRLDLRGCRICDRNAQTLQVVFHIFYSKAKVFLARG